MKRLLLSESSAALLFCIVLPLAAFGGNAIDQFRQRNPDSAGSYVLLIETNIDLEIYHENERYLGAFAMMNALLTKLGDAMPAKKVFLARMAQERESHEKSMSDWGQLRSEIAKDDNLIIYRREEQGRAEQGYMLIRNGEMLKKWPSFESRNLLIEEPARIGRAANIDAAVPSGSP
jgi:hypothetical protein